MNPSSAETRRLIVRALQGDRQSIEELLAHYRPQLRRMVAVRMDSRLKARLDPSDIVQSVLAEAAQKMVAFQQEPEQFFPWLRQLAWDELARLHRDHIRTKKRSISREEDDWRGQAADESMMQLADRLATQQLGPGSRLIHKEMRTRVRAALDQLAPQDREVLVLRFLEQLDISDTAAALAISESAVKSRQFRAIERLGKLLSDLRTEGQP
jgi:RNA polymerase sigma-70 factor (ECF subfamily)